MSTATYNLNQIESKATVASTLRDASQFLSGEWWKLYTALFAIILNSSATVATPFLISLAIDDYIATANLAGLNTILIILGSMYLVTAIVSYLQTRLVGQVSQRFLFRLRQKLFAHTQELPVAFFQANSAGDIIARVNNDTEKLNNFFSGSIFQFVSSLFTFLGIGIFIFFLNWQLSIVVWTGVIFVLICNTLLGNQVEAKNKESLRSSGDMSGFIDENLVNFKALVAFNKGNYLNATFAEKNQQVYSRSIWAQVLNGFFNPLYSFAGNIAQVAVLAAGLYLLSQGQLTIGLLIGFISYSQRFYEPLRTLGNVWGTMQEALAAWKRIENLLKIK
jgi:ATP-binding cassette subfamily B protein